MQLDVEFVRSQFPALSDPDLDGWAFFENAGGSYACRQTIEALVGYYRRTKVQPYAPYPAAEEAGEAMDRSQARWAEALGVAPGEVNFGPSTSQNTYVLAHAFGEILGSGDQVIVTNQDHEANTGVFRRMADRAGATLKEWRIDPTTGLLDPADLDALLTARTRLLTFPHCSNIVGQENPVAEIVAKAHAVGARVIVDAVSYAPHGLADVAALDADVYLFSLYKVYSVHQGLMVIRNGLADELPNQGHFFNAEHPTKRLTPAGPDHAQVAAAGAVLDYVEALDVHHGGPGGSGGLRSAADRVTTLWQDHETRLLQPVLARLSAMPGIRLLGPTSVGSKGLHRCPTVAFVPSGRMPEEIAVALAAHRVMASGGHFYAYRVLQGMDVDPYSGAVRVSWVHYTTEAEIHQMIDALQAVLDT